MRRSVALLLALCALATVATASRWPTSDEAGEDTFSVAAAIARHHKHGWVVRT
jgi:hypothetical protein